MDVPRGRQGRAPRRTPGEFVGATRQDLFGSTGAVVVGRHTFDHLLLGAGTSLFGGVNPSTVALERTRLIDAEGVSHLTFRVSKPR